jgi:SpoIVB peptidase S55
MPLSQVKPGMTGEAYTIFAGNKIEKFGLQVIGILPNLVGPRQSIILVQLKGPEVEHTGVVAGMSGSPVYIDGKLVGALSLKFGIFTKEPLAGVTPIEDMLSLPIGGPASGTAHRASAKTAAWSSSLAAVNMASQRYSLPTDWSQAAGLPGSTYLEPIATPLNFSGFTPATIRQYAADWMGYGMVAAPGGTEAPEPDDGKIIPGDMVSMVLVQGDLSLSAACTVTTIVDNRVYACGHPMFGFGASRMPMARGRVLTTLASDFNSTKIVNTGGVIGAITQDRLTAVMGRLGAGPPMIPVDLSVVTPTGDKKFRIEMISDPKLTPLLMGVVAFNGLTQNTAYGEGTTLRLSGAIDIAGHSPVDLENMYAPTDQFVPDGTFVATNVQQVFTRIFANPYETPRITGVKLRVESLPERRVASIQDAWAESSEAAPGQKVGIKVMLRPYRGSPEIKEIPITIPMQAARGRTLRVLVSDSSALNRMTNLFAGQGRLSSLEQLISLLNRERRNNRLYVTLLRPTPTLLVEDKELPDAPLSEINVLNQRQMPGNPVLLRESTAGQWSLQMNEIIAGSASVFIKVK